MNFTLEVFNHSEFRVHKTFILSKASFFNIFLIFFTFLLPFLLINSSRDFWITEVDRFHRPSVRFKDQVIIKVIYNSSIKLWSTIPAFKQKYINDGTFVNCNMTYNELASFTSGSVLGQREDQGINVDIRIPAATDVVYGVQALIVLDYQILDQFTFKSEAIIALDNIYAMNGKKMTFFGNLQFYQKRPLPFGSHYNEPLTIFGNGQSITETRMDLLMQQYMLRNFTSTINDDTKVFSWTPVTTSTVVSTNVFDLKIRVRYKAQMIRYKSTFWYSLKFAWLQYLSILFVFCLFFSRVRFYLFNNRLLSTTVIHPQPLGSSLE